MSPLAVPTAEVDLHAEIERLRAEVAALTARAETAEALADHDVLTRALNRRGFMTVLNRSMAFCRRHDVQAVLLAGKRLQVARLMKKAEILPDQLDAMDALRILQQSDVSMALVHDEYGNLEGVVTPADLLSAIVGNFASHQDAGDAPMIVEREDGSLLVAGALPADALADRLDIDLPDDRDYATAAGYVLSVLKRLPEEGEHFTAQDWRFEVVDMDGRKIDKLLVSPVAVVDEAVTD